MLYLNSNPFEALRRQALGLPPMSHGGGASPGSPGMDYSYPMSHYPEDTLVPPVDPIDRQPSLSPPQLAPQPQRFSIEQQERVPSSGDIGWRDILGSLQVSGRANTLGDALANIGAGLMNAPTLALEKKWAEYKQMQAAKDDEERRQIRADELAFGKAQEERRTEALIGSSRTKSQADIIKQYREQQAAKSRSEDVARIFAEIDPGSKEGRRAKAYANLYEDTGDRLALEKAMEELNKGKPLKYRYPADGIIEVQYPDGRVIAMSSPSRKQKGEPEITNDQVGPFSILKARFPDGSYEILQTRYVDSNSGKGFSVNLTAGEWESIDQAAEIQMNSDESVQVGTPEYFEKYDQIRVDMAVRKLVIKARAENEARDQVLRLRTNIDPSIGEDGGDPRPYTGSGKAVRDVAANYQTFNEIKKITESQQGRALMSENGISSEELVAEIEEAVKEIRRNNPAMTQAQALETVKRNLGVL